MEFIDRLLEFGLTRQEATIYQTLLLHGEVTGYEAAKLTGISRSNTYNGLAGLVEKGAAYVIEGNVTKYIPVDVKDFSANIIRNLKTLRESLIESAPDKLVECQGYVTITGKKHVMNQLRNMIQNAEYRIYVLAGEDLLAEVKQELENLQKRNIKIVIITDKPFRAVEHITVYQNDGPIQQFGVIIDSQEVLTGESAQRENTACLYSKNSNFVAVYKEMLRNKISLITLQGGNEK
ncbi:TrmB family transcriptional regulator [[Clostridium] polysaccharolyticum]|uniref:Sugar-specific transcriptional regulator TrmB n=1 Tax=[Clostridium] polysaccharolyticum TaxID=29364 RepID=A0A1I0CTG9_9FIRM|nr:TrmB family transcriptional regulator [[Clostridium] polysaccharolyticum]SET23090.1 Sugar-specific transcriptional regulator TrmB [[Clostridium] polysaccharolyticum]